MKHVLAVLVFLASTSAFAGERFIAAIVSVAGADTSNISTGTPFFIPSAAKITIWCNAAAYVITDTTTAASATTALPLSANEKFPTSTGTQVKATTTAAAGGAIVRIFGTAAVTCYVFERRGDE